MSTAALSRSISRDGASAMESEQRAASDGRLTRKHIRGSSLLLLGRMVSLGLNLATQVLTARYLSKDDFGAFAYALAAVTFGASVVSLGLDKCATRFVPAFHERRDWPRMFGTILLSIGTIVALGLVLVISTFALKVVLARSVVGDERSVALLLILITLAPVEALNHLCAGLVATFAGARAIFIRRHVVGPALKLLVVAILVATKSSVYVLAIGFLASGVVGTALYYAYLAYVLRNTGLWREFHLRRTAIPAREVFGFSLPLISSDVALAARGFMGVYFLGFFHAPAEVASLRAVLPLARLNKVVFETFQFLFMPLASRLHARDDRSDIDHMYWRTALWITVLTFPLFLVTFALAEPLAVLLLGERYRDVGSVLAWLSFGFFFNAALGFNTLTLKVFGDVRKIVRNDLVATVITLGLYVALIPSYGALGAAAANCVALVIHNLVNQVSLLRTSGITLFPRRYLLLYSVMLLISVVLLGVQAYGGPPLYVGLALAGLGGLVVLRLARPLLELEETFPELARLPLVRRFFGQVKVAA